MSRLKQLAANVRNECRASNSPMDRTVRRLLEAVEALEGVCVRREALEAARDAIDDLDHRGRYLLVRDALDALLK